MPDIANGADHILLQRKKCFHPKVFFLRFASQKEMFSRKDFFSVLLVIGFSVERLYEPEFSPVRAHLEAAVSVTTDDGVP